jgi:hypothetical protein
MSDEQIDGGSAIVRCLRSSIHLVTMKEYENGNAQTISEEKKVKKLNIHTISWLVHMHSNRQIQALGHNGRVCSASYAAFESSIGVVVPVLGTGENKGRWGAWGKKLLTIFWKLLEETRSTNDLNSVEHRSRTLLLVYFSRYESTTLFTIYRHHPIT